MPAEEQDFIDKLINKLLEFEYNNFSNLANM